MEVIGWIEATYSAVGPEREQAQARLQAWVHTEGGVETLLDVLERRDLAEAVQQASAILLRDAVHPGTNPEGGHALQRPETRAAVRQRLVPLIVHATRRVRSQLLSALERLMISEYPQHWPELLPGVVALLSTPADGEPFRAGLQIARSMLRRYEHKPERERVPLDAIAGAVLPACLAASQGVLLPQFSSQARAADVLRLVLKLFHTASTKSTPPSLRADRAAFQQWATLTASVVAAPLADEQYVSADSDEEDADKLAQPVWKCKKWALAIVLRWFLRYTSRSRSNSGEKAVGTQFRRSLALPCMAAVLALLQRWAPHRLLGDGLQALDAAVRLGECYSAFRDHTGGFFRERLFPALCFGPRDVQRWAEPREVLRDHFAETGELEPRRYAVFFWTTLIRYRGWQHLTDALSHVHGLLEAPDETVNPALLYGALSVLRDFQAPILGCPAVSAELVQRLLARCVFPRLRHPEPAIRQMAISVIRAYSSPHTTSPLSQKKKKSGADSPAPSGLEEALQTVVRLVFEDPNLVVRVHAAVALGAVVRGSPELQAAVRPHIGAVLEALFGLLAASEVEDLARTLQIVVLTFRAEVKPYASAVVQRFAENFITFCRATVARMESGGEHELLGMDDEDGAALSARECLMGISSMLSVLRRDSAALQALEPQLLPLFAEVLRHPALHAFTQEVLQNVNYLTFYGPSPFSDGLRALFGDMMRCFREWGADCVRDFGISLDNYVTRDQAFFVTADGGSRVAMVAEMYELVLRDSAMTEEDHLEAGRIAESLLLNLRGPAIEAWVPRMVQLTLATLSRQDYRRPKVRLMMLQVLLNALHGSPAIANDVLRATDGAWRFTLMQLQRVLPDLASARDHLLPLLALCAVLRLPRDSRPLEIQESLPDLLKLLIHCAGKTEAIRAEFAHPDDEDSENSDVADRHDLDDEEDDDDGDAFGSKHAFGIEPVPDSEDVLVDDDGSELALRELLAGQNFGGPDDLDDLGIDDDFFDELHELDGDEEDDEYESVLDDIDPVRVLIDSLGFLQASDPDAVAVLVSSLDPSSQRVLAEFSRRVSSSSN